MKIVLRGGLELEDPLEVTIRFVEAYPGYDSRDSPPGSFDESDLRHANRGGARISAAQIAAILERRRRIERALRSIAPEASLADEPIPWHSLTRLFDALRRDLRDRLLEDDEGTAPEAPCADPDAGQRRAVVSRARTSRSRAVRGARDDPGPRATSKTWIETSPPCARSSVTL